MAHQYHRILFATDLSEASTVALQYAVDYAVNNHSTVIVFHVVNQRSIVCSKILATFLNEGDEHKIRREKAIAAIKRMEALVGIHRQRAFDHPLENVNQIEYLAVHYGKIAQEIVEKANRWGCELTILGPRKKRLLGRILFPSISRKVKRWSDKPVHVVKKSIKESTDRRP
jgi:nucleotide-binding universal stress UspA family protein